MSTETNCRPAKGIKKEKKKKFNNYGRDRPPRAVTRNALGCEYVMFDGNFTSDFFSSSSPVLWIRIDPDMTILRSIEFEQPDWMWQYMLRYERCVISQYEVPILFLSSRTTGCSLLLHVWLLHHHYHPLSMPRTGWTFSPNQASPTHSPRCRQVQETLSL